MPFVCGGWYHNGNYRKKHTHTRAQLTSGILFPLFVVNYGILLVTVMTPIGVSRVSDFSIRMFVVSCLTLSLRSALTKYVWFTAVSNLPYKFVCYLCGHHNQFSHINYRFWDVNGRWSERSCLATFVRHLARYSGSAGREKWMMVLPLTIYKWPRNQWSDGCMSRWRNQISEPRFLPV